MRRRCTPQLPRSRRGVEAIKRGLPERPLFTAEVDYNQTVVHKTARLQYYCHLNGLAPARTRRRVLPRSRHRGCWGETWKLNARDRSVIIQDKRRERRGARGGQSPTIGLRFAKKSSIWLLSDDVARRSTESTIVDRDQSRVQILSVCICVWPLL